MKEIKYEEYDDDDQQYFLIYTVPDDAPDDITESEADLIATGVRKA